MRKVRIEVRKSELQTQTIEVGEWEVPVLMAVHGPEAVQHVKALPKAKGEVPDDAASEYARLAEKYGSNEESGLAFVAEVYGQHGAGLMNLSRAIEASQQKGGMAGGDAEEEDEPDQKQAASA